MCHLSTLPNWSDYCFGVFEMLKKTIPQSIFPQTIRSFSLQCVTIRFFKWYWPYFTKKISKKIYLFYQIIWSQSSPRSIMLFNVFPQFYKFLHILMTILTHKQNMLTGHSNFACKIHVEMLSVMIDLADFPNSPSFYQQYLHMYLCFIVGNHNDIFQTT